MPDVLERQRDIGGGWWWPGASRKAHFFGPDSRSLCSRWVAIGNDPASFPLAEGPGPDDCRACWKKLGHA